ncbi:MAG: DUF4113 domain-containing protein [Brevundimonas sp.]|nr:DUF4113 domain-containing protein [Brevundimonas sp.]
MGKKGSSRAICSPVSQYRSLISRLLRSLNQIVRLTSMGPEPRANNRSPRYTTRLSDLMEATA